MALQVKKRYPVPRRAKSYDKLPQHVQKRDQRRQSLRRSVTIGLVLLVFAVVGGIVYTWYTGQQKTALIKQAPPARTGGTNFKPPKVPSNAKIGVSIQSSMLQVKPGENASVTVRTNPEAICTVSVKYNKVPASDSGLIQKTADEFGVADWSWTVPVGTPKGKWPVDVTCKNKVYSAVVSGELIVE